jgi:hypothetical protein
VNMNGSGWSKSRFGDGVLRTCIGGSSDTLNMAFRAFETYRQYHQGGRSHCSDMESITGAMCTDVLCVFFDVVSMAYMLRPMLASPLRSQHHFWGPASTRNNMHHRQHVKRFHGTVYFGCIVGSLDMRDSQEQSDASTSVQSWKWMRADSTCSGGN